MFEVDGAYYEKRLLLKLGVSIKKSFVWPFVITIMTILVTKELNKCYGWMYQICPELQEYFIPIMIALSAYSIPLIYKKSKGKYLLYKYEYRI